MPIAARPASIVQRLLPVLGWLPTYRRDWLLPDVLAGLAVWAVMVPESMAYASIVGVPPIMGLYTIVPPLIAYALLGTSRLLVVGPDTATGLISALTVGAIVAKGTPEFKALTSTLAILIGAFFLLMWGSRLRSLADCLVHLRSLTCRPAFARPSRGRPGQEKATGAADRPEAGAGQFNDG